MSGDTCPGCGGTMDAIVGVTTDKPPDPGDCTMCSGCGSLCMFKKDLDLRLLSEEEERVVLSRSEIRRVVFAHRARILRQAMAETDPFEL